MNRENLIKKWLSDELNATENVAFKQLDDYQSHIDIIENAQHFRASKISEIDDFNVFKTRYSEQKPPIRKLYWTHIRIASVLVIALGIYFTFFYNNFTEIQTLANQKTTIELPDNSSVRLNALSRLKYSKRKWDTNRAVNLEGEAYFIVAEGKQFDVLTSVGVVTVVGTEFNVKQRQNYFEVKCYEGIVKVSSDNIIRQLKAGDVYTVSNGKFSEGKTTYNEPQWTNAISSFESISLDQVLSELERQYNIKIILKNVNTDRLFSGGFTHKDLDNALISITQPMNLTYEISSSNSVVIYGQ